MTVLVIEAGTHHVGEPVIDVPGGYTRVLQPPWSLIVGSFARLHGSRDCQPEVGLDVLDRTSETRK